jgi:hypothetical protein
MTVAISQASIFFNKVPHLPQRPSAANGHKEERETTAKQKKLDPRATMYYLCLAKSPLLFDQKLVAEIKSFLENAGIVNLDLYIEIGMRMLVLTCQTPDAGQ